MIITEREYLERLSIKPNKYLASSLGYQGRKRWIQIYYEWGLVDKPVCFDGKKFHFGSRVAWDLFAQSFSFVEQCRYLGNQSNCLLLDRRYQILYGGDREEISRLFKDPDSLKLLELSDRYEKRDYLPKFKELLALFLRGVFFSAGVITVVAIAAKLILMYREVKEFSKQIDYVNNKEEAENRHQQLHETQDLLNKEIDERSKDIDKFTAEEPHANRSKLEPPK